MANDKIVEAVEFAVAEMGQPGTLATKIIAWFDSVSSGNEDLTKRQDAFRHMELLYDDCVVNAEEQSEGSD